MKKIALVFLSFCLIFSSLPIASAEIIGDNSFEIAAAVRLIEAEEDRVQLLNNGASDYKQWAQGDSRWGSLPLGSSSCTVASHGCLITSVTKLIIQAGLKDASSFDVGTLVRWMNSNGGFTSSGDMYWGKPCNYVSGFSNYGHILDYGSYSSSSYNNQLLSWIKQGYHLVIGVKGNGHWIAVDEAQSIATGTIYIMDTLSSGANSNITLSSRYSTFNTVHAYKGGTTPSASCTITFNANGGSCSTGSKTVSVGSAIGSLPTATRTGHSFDGWYTAASGGSRITENTTFSSNTTVYAHWTANTYTVSYDANGGTGAPSSQTKTYNLSLQLSNATPEREGYLFLGWATSPSATSAEYQPGDYYTLNSAVTLYAVWEKEECRHNFDSVVIPATCEDFEKICYTCKDCGYTYTEYTAAIFSEWSTTRPTGVDESLIETKTQYRYRDYETTTSYDPSLSGWTRTGSSWEESGTGNIQYVKSWPSGFSTSHSLYSQYNKSPKSASESDTDRTTINSDRVTGYLCYHWCRNSYANGPINRKTSETYTSEFNTFHAFYSDTMGSEYDPNGTHGGGSYYNPNGSCCKDTYWYYPVAVNTQSYTTYRNLFSYERWSAWSDWSDTEYTASDTREVETRTMYRYAEGASAWSDKYPEDTGSGIVQTKNQYRYSDQKTITSYEPTISGYTVIGSSWQQSGSGNVQYVKSWPSGFVTSHSLYAQYNQSPRSASESNTDKTIINSDQVTGYLYYHWCRGTYNEGPINRGSKSTQQGEFSAFHAFYSTTNPATLTQPNDPDGSYQHGNADCCRDSYWYFCVPVYTQSYTTYRNLFTHATWTPWSDWSDTVYTASSTRKVETRKMYRTITSELGEHVWNEGRVVTEATCTAEGLKSYTCTVCGATKSEVLAKLEHRYEDGYCGSCGAVDPEFIFIPAIITAGSISAYPGDTVTIPVTISENPGFAGFTFVIRYDTEAMTLSNISKGDILLSSESGSFTKNTSGATINWTDYQNITSDGELLELTFVISDDAVVGAYDISLERKENDATNFVNEKSQAVSAEFVGGQITVSVRNTKIASGYSGDTSWVLTEDGVMTFSGAGKMKNYDYGADRPWDDYAEQITSVVVEEGITRVGNCAFMGMTNLESVTLPESLTHMGEAAFYGTGLYSVDIPAALWTIQPYTFKNCTNLTTVIFHEGNLEKISDGAFYGTGLMEVVLPDCLKILDTFAFKGCANLTSITIGSGLTELREAVFYGTDISEITIPEGITKIGPYVFKNCVKLETVNMPESLTSVGEASFYACTKLAELDLPDAVTTIGDYAFRKCTSLASVDFSSSLVTIGESSFYGCSSITGLIIPRGVTTIKGYAFKGCTDLEYVSLPNTLTTIGESAFHSCTGLSEITVPAKVSSIGAYCFSGSTGIKSFEFLDDAPTIGEGAFNKITATAFYPEGNATWTSDVMQNYGGTITWEAN